MQVILTSSKAENCGQISLTGTFQNTGTKCYFEVLNLQSNIAKNSLESRCI